MTITSSADLAAFFRKVLVLIAAAGLAACTSTNADPSLPRGAQAYTAMPAPAGGAGSSYRINAFDVLQVTTFNEPGLTFPDLPVDASGAFSFPFIGRVDAEGLTAYELEDEIKSRLDQRFTQNAQVTIFVKTASSQIFTVEGDVNKPGAFEYAGRTTLLQAIARAGSPTDTAKNKEIVVFRIVNNERYGAVFDLNHIREGRADDPELYPGDTVFVGYSAIKSGWREFLTIGPILNAFTRF